MKSSRNRAISILELLALHPLGLKLTDIAGRLDIPLAATRRLLAELDEGGYVHNSGKKDAFRLGVKLPALGLSYLGEAASPTWCNRSWTILPRGLENSSGWQSSRTTV